MEATRSCAPSAPRGPCMKAAARQPRHCSRHKNLMTLSLSQPSTQESVDSDTRRLGCCRWILKTTRPAGHDTKDLVLISAALLEFRALFCRRGHAIQVCSCSNCRCRASRRFPPARLRLRLRVTLRLLGLCGDARVTPRLLFVCINPRWDHAGERQCLCLGFENNFL